MEVKVEYNVLESGPRVHNWTDSPILVRLNNIINGKKVSAYVFDLKAGWWTQQSRQWYCNWNVEAFQWRKGNLVKIHEENFTPSGRVVHFHLDKFVSLEDQIQYTQACITYVNYWGCSGFVIETNFPKELKEKFPEGNFVSILENNQDCYVNYYIKQTPDANGTYRKFGVPSVSGEYYYYNDHHPHAPETKTPYELALDILFGPDYKTLPEFFPYDWCLKQEIVS